MHVRVQIRDPELLHLALERGLRLARGVVVAQPLRRIQTVAVDVHVVVGVVGAFKVHGAGGGVAAVDDVGGGGLAVGEGVGEGVGAVAGLAGDVSGGVLEVWGINISVLWIGDGLYIYTEREVG